MFKSRCNTSKNVMRATQYFWDIDCPETMLDFNFPLNWGW